MLEEIILDNLNHNQIKLLDNWKFEKLDQANVENIRAIANKLLEKPSYYHNWYKNHKTDINHFLRSVPELLKRTERLSKDEKDKLFEFFRYESENHALKVDSFPFSTENFINYIERLRDHGVDTQRVLDIHLESAKEHHSRNLNSTIAEPVIIEGGVERLEYIRDVLKKFGKGKEKYDFELIKNSNELIETGENFEEISQHYIDYAEQLKGDHIYLTQNSIMRHMPAILRKGGINLLKKSTEGMNWLSEKEPCWSEMWFSKVADFSDDETVDKKKLLLKKLTKREKATVYQIWNLEADKKIKDLENDIILFSSFQKMQSGDYKSRADEVFEKVLNHVINTDNPAKELEKVIKFRNKNKRKTKNFTPLRAIQFIELYKQFGKDVSEIEKDISKKNKLVLKLPEFYDYFNKKKGTQESLEIVKKLHETNPESVLSFSPNEFNKLIDFYKEHFNQNLTTLIKDSEIMGLSLKTLPNIYLKLNDTELKDKSETITNHIRKKKQRNLIIASEKVANSPAFDSFASKIPASAGKKDIIDLFRIYETNFTSAKNHGIENRFTNKIKRLKNNLSVKELATQLSVQNLLKTKYKAFAGTNKIPDEYRPIVDKCISANKNLGRLEFSVLSDGIKNYIAGGNLLSQEVFNDRKGNKSIREEYGKRVENFRNIPEKSYTLGKTNGKSLQDIIDSEISQIQAVISPTGIKIQSQEDIDFDKIPKQYHEEIQLHIDNIDNAEIRNSKTTGVTFYFGGDFLENLQMGSFFNSCLSIGRFNFKYALQHCIDANKGVLYAKNQNGKIIARNRIALADEGIVLTRFYDYENLNNQWEDYVQSISNETGEDVYVPTTGLISNKFSKTHKLPKVKGTELGDFYWDGFKKGSYYCVKPQDK